MKWFQNLKISKKLLIAFSLMIVAMLAIGYAGYRTSATINGQQEVIFNVRFPSFNYLLQADRDLQQLLVAERSMIFANVNSDIFGELAGAYEENMKQAEERWEKYKALATTPEEKAIIPQYEKAREEWKAMTKQVVEGRKEDTRQGRRLALDLTLGEAGAKFEAMRDYLDKLQEVNLNLAEKASKRAAATFRDSITLLGVILAAGVLIGIFFAWGISRSISRPVKTAVKLAEAIQSGDLTNRLDLKQNDEVGLLATALDSMSENLESRAYLASEIAKGDLTSDVNLFSEKDSLGLALRTMVDNLNDLLSRVNQASEEVTSGSGQVSDSSQALSQGASEQAASLQEITSSMTQVGSQTKTNAENAAQANQLSKAAQEAAEEGNTQMQEMVYAMSEINDSSKEIAKIIKTIDDIAFQTNLLALNAAVEAARAGKHGKGFAVVAQEVRNLAGRSAKAARETAELIEGSVKKVEKGSDIANRTAEALTRIVEGVSKATDLVGEIAAASNEQAQGISQINTGLNQIEQVTQQNTANAEQTASAAEELSSLAVQLRHLLTRFQLKGRGSSKPRLRPQVQEPAPPRRQIQASPQGWGGAPSEAGPPAPEGNRVVRPEDVISLDDDDFGKY